MVGGPGTRLIHKFKSGTNSLNEELGRHIGVKTTIGSVNYVGMNVTVLWKCPVYNSTKKQNLISIRFSFYQPQIGSQTYHQMPTFQLLGCSLHQGRTSTENTGRTQSIKIESVGGKSEECSILDSFSYN